MTVPSVDYRKDVQGLRAIGIALVVIFHIWVGKISGGVDVFFVVSSYLMTRSLVGAYEKKGIVDPIAFWGRIALRILPTAFLVIMVTLALAAFIVPHSLWIATYVNGSTSALQLINIQLMRDATDYLARGTPPSPFQQFWALSTQMQFYAILPMLIWTVAFASRRFFKVRYSIALHVAVMGGLAALSFAFALWILSINPAPHYFNPGARLWEFMVGAICAVLTSRTKLSTAASSLIGWVGLFLIVSCGILIPASAPFPGVAALMPVSGAAMVLFSGAGRHQDHGAGRLLSARPLQTAAELSFAIYLWHWPILVFAEEICGTAQLNAVQGGVVIVLAVLAAMLTKRFVEDPFRRLNPGTGRMGRSRVMTALFPYAICVALLLPVLTFLWGWNWYFTNISRTYVASATVPAPLGKITAGDTTLPDDAGAQFISMGRFLPKPNTDGCNQSPKSTNPVLCTYGKNDPKAFTIAIVGGSHSLQWFPAIEDIAERNGFRVLNITKSACTMNGNYIGPDVVSSAIPACAAWSRAAMRKVIELKPDVVLTTATRPRPDGVGDFVPLDYRESWRVLTRHGIGVIAIRDNPRPGFFAPVCLERHSNDITQCDLRRPDHLSDPNPLETTPAETELVQYMDLSDYMCGPQICPAMVAGMMVYRDNSHLSVPFVQSMIPAIEGGLLPAIETIRRYRFEQLALLDMESASGQP